MHRPRSAIVDRAITSLDPGWKKMTPADKALFTQYFDPSGSGDIDDGFVRSVREKYRLIRGNMRSLRFDCDPGSWTLCGSSSKWCIGGRLMWTCFGNLHVCSAAYKTATPDFKIETIIHESVHNALLTTDRAYSNQGGFNKLSPRGKRIFWAAIEFPRQDSRIGDSVPGIAGKQRHAQQPRQLRGLCDEGVINAKRNRTIEKMPALFQSQANSPRARASLFLRGSGLLSRPCACGNAPGVSGECAECQKHYLKRNGIEPSSAQQMLSSRGGPHGAGFRALAAERAGHDFSRVPVHSMSIGAQGAIGSLGSRREVFINGPGDDPKPTPTAPAPVKKDKTPPAKTVSNCPTDIQVAQVGPANDIDFGKNGFLTGWGGISLMEVSDPSGKTWNGTAIRESLRNIKNTCGKRGRNACSNVSDEQEGAGGSTFKVGAESNFLGKAKLPAAKNKFYDLHVFATKEASLLHELKKDCCEVQCEQSFDCSGKRFGPDFIISYTMTRDAVKSGSRNIDVTRVGMKKAAVVRQAAPTDEKP